MPTYDACIFFNFSKLPGDRYWDKNINCPEYGRGEGDRPWEEQSTTDQTIKME